MAGFGSFVFGTGLLILSVLCLLGLIYLTPLAFGKKTYVSMSGGEKNVVKIAIIVQWITIGVALLSTLWATFGMENSTLAKAYYF
jgi:hypothetical protein